MPHKPKEDLCVLEVFKEIWKMLEASKDLNDAKAGFKKLMLELILQPKD